MMGAVGMHRRAQRQDDPHGTEETRVDQDQRFKDREIPERMLSEPSMTPEHWDREIGYDVTHDRKEDFPEPGPEQMTRGSRFLAQLGIEVDGQRTLSCSNCGSALASKTTNCPFCGAMLVDWPSEPCFVCGRKTLGGGATCEKCGEWLAKVKDLSPELTDEQALQVLYKIYQEAGQPTAARRLLAQVGADMPEPQEQQEEALPKPEFDVGDDVMLKDTMLGLRKNDRGKVVGVQGHMIGVVFFNRPETAVYVDKEQLKKAPEEKKDEEGGALTEPRAEEPRVGVLLLDLIGVETLPGAPEPLCEVTDEYERA